MPDQSAATPDQSAAAVEMREAAERIISFVAIHGSIRTHYGVSVACMLLETGAAPARALRALGLHLPDASIGTAARTAACEHWPYAGREPGK
jgi:hypothetical protein